LKFVKKNQLREVKGKEDSRMLKFEPGYYGETRITFKER